MDYNQYSHLWAGFQWTFTDTGLIPRSVSLEEDEDEFIDDSVILDCDEAEHTSVPCKIWKRNGYHAFKTLPIYVHSINEPSIPLEHTRVTNAAFAQELVYHIDNSINIESIVAYIYNDWLKLQTFKEFMSDEYLTDIYTLKIVLIAESFDGIENANVDHNVVSQWAKVRFDDIDPNWENPARIESLDQTLSLLEKVGDFGNPLNDKVCANHRNYRDMIVAFNTKFPKFEAKDIIPINVEYPNAKQFFKDNEQKMLAERTRIMKHPRFELEILTSNEE